MSTLPKPQSTPPYTNGFHETPLAGSGVSLRPPSPQAQPTVFPEDLPLRGLHGWLYGLHRFQLGGLSVSRYIAAAWLVVAALAAIGLLPGRWITVAIALLFWLSQIALGMRHQRQNYIAFTPTAPPSADGNLLDPSEKIAIHATGLLSVEGRYQKFTALPGFYRTFATGEHALLCLMQDRRWFRILHWPPEETGMWYAFVMPSDIQHVASGELHFGGQSYPALALEYRLEIPPGPRRKHAEIRNETIYITTPNRQDIQRIYTDLQANLPDDRIKTLHSTV